LEKETRCENVSALEKTSKNTTLIYLILIRRYARGWKTKGIKGEGLWRARFVNGKRNSCGDSPPRRARIELSYDKILIIPLNQTYKHTSGKREREGERKGERREADLRSTTQHAR